MTILKRKVKRTRKEDAQFIGVYIPKGVSSYLSLYCLSIGMTKSYILKSLVTEWMESAKLNLPKDVLLKNIANKAFQTWENPVGKRKNFNSFLSELRIELKFKGLEEYANTIIEIIENEKNTKKGS